MTKLPFNLAEHLVHFQQRTLQQALTEALPSYWAMRAETFHSVGTPECDLIAQNCLHHAQLLTGELPDYMQDEIREVLEVGVKHIDFTGGATDTNGQVTDEQVRIDRRQLQIEAAYITHDGLAHIPPPQPLIESYLQRDSLAWLAGKPGDGKSFIAIDMAYSVATGHNWQGHQVHQGTVLYIAAEGASGLSIRANAWCQANGNPDYIPIFYLPMALRLTKPDETDVQALAQALQDLQPVLVIIDTQARVTVGAEENSAKDMGFFIDALETLRRSYPATYLTVHHTPRNGENLRGSIALEGAAETVLLSVKEGDILTLKCPKQKNAAPPPDFELYMQPVGESIVCSHEAVELVDSTTPTQDQLLKVMEDLYERDEVGSTELLKVSKMTDATFYRAVKTLVNRGKLIKREQGSRKFYRLP